MFLSLILLRYNLYWLSFPTCQAGTSINSGKRLSQLKSTFMEKYEGFHKNANIVFSAVANSTFLDAFVENRADMELGTARNGSVWNC